MSGADSYKQSKLLTQPKASRKHISSSPFRALRKFSATHPPTVNDHRQPTCQFTKWQCKLPDLPPALTGMYFSHAKINLSRSL